MNRGPIDLPKYGCGDMSVLELYSMKLLHDARAARLSQQCELALTDLLTILISQGLLPPLKHISLKQSAS